MIFQGGHQGSSFTRVSRSPYWRAPASGQHWPEPIGFRFGVFTPHAAKSGHLRCPPAPSLREREERRGPGSPPVAGKQQRVQTAAPGSQQGAGAAHRGAEPASRWPAPLRSAGTGLPNRVVWELRSGAIPWPPLL